MIQDPVRMVVVNIIFSSLLLLGVIFYRFVYPKKKINLFFLFGVISLLPLISLLRAGDYESGDFNIHVYRIISFYDALKEGIAMPSWAAQLNATYGIPVYVFNYSLPYYFVSLFHFLGMSFIESTKLYLGLSFFISGMFMYLWIKELTRNKLAAFTAGIFYLFAPYHLIDIHFRATLGESLIFTTVPVISLFITKFFNDRKYRFLLWIAFATGLLFLAHPLLAAVFLPVFAGYAGVAGFIKRNIRQAVYVICALGVGFFASFYIWIPYIIYSPYTSRLPEDYVASFYPFTYLFYSPWRYGLLFQGPQGELVQIIGYTHILFLIAAIVFLWRRSLQKRIIPLFTFWIATCLFAIFLMHPASQFLWEFVPSVASMLIPYARILLVVNFCISVIVAYIVISLQKRPLTYAILYIVLILTIGSTILSWGHRKIIREIDDAYLREYAWKSVEITPFFMNSKWVESSEFWFPDKPKQELEIIHGRGSTKQILRTTTKHVYLVNAQTQLTIRENTLYFPGWILRVNSQEMAIYPDKKGVINAKLSQGLQYVELIYEDIPFLKISKIFSLLSFGLILFALLYSYSPWKIKRVS